MNKIFRNGLMMLAAGALAVSCADYNDLGGFSAEPDPAYTNEYGGLRAVKTYINREKYPNATQTYRFAKVDFNMPAVLDAQ